MSDLAATNCGCGCDTAVAAIMDAVFPTTTCSETMAAVLSGFCFSSPAAADVDAETTTMAAIPTAGSF